MTCPKLIERHRSGTQYGPATPPRPSFVHQLQHRFPRWQGRLGSEGLAGDGSGGVGEADGLGQVGSLGVGDGQARGEGVAGGGGVYYFHLEPADGADDAVAADQHGAAPPCLSTAAPQPRSSSRVAICLESMILRVRDCRSGSKPSRRSASLWFGVKMSTPYRRARQALFGNGSGIQDGENPEPLA